MRKWQSYLIGVLGLALLAGFAPAETPIPDTDPLNTVPDGRLLYSPTRAGAPDVVSVTPPTGYEVTADDSTASPEANNPGTMVKGDPFLTATSATWRGRKAPSDN